MCSTNDATCAENHNWSRRLRSWGGGGLCCLAISLFVVCLLRVIFLLHGRSLYNGISNRPYYVRAPCSQYRKNRGGFGLTVERQLLPAGRAASVLPLRLSSLARVLSCTSLI